MFQLFINIMYTYVLNLLVLWKKIKYVHYCVDYNKTKTEKLEFAF